MTRSPAIDAAAKPSPPRAARRPAVTGLTVPGLRSDCGMRFSFVEMRTSPSTLSAGRSSGHRRAGRFSCPAIGRFFCAAPSSDWPMTTRSAGDYRDGMQLRLSDKRQRDWIVAAVLAVASLLQISLTAGPAHQQVLGALFAVATCAPVGFRQRYPATAGVVAQGLMALDFLTWHNLAAGGWTIAWFCSLYGLAVWS